MPHQAISRKPTYLYTRASVFWADKKSPRKLNAPLQSPDIFGALYRACRDPPDRDKLTRLLKDSWSENDLADFARWHFGTPFIGLSRRKLMAIINSALTRDYFARRFLKERQQRSVSKHASFRSH